MEINGMYLSKENEMNEIELSNCGGVKPRPMRWTQEQRFINNTSEEKKS